MWPWNWGIEWKQIVMYVITLVVGGILTALGLWIRETRRKLNFTAQDVYYGPTMSVNQLFGREYPQEDSITLSCDVSFFSNKTETTGLHNFRVEFYRQTYMGAQVEVTIPADRVICNLRKRDTPYTLKTIELPSRQFVSFTMDTFLDRSHWDALRSCDGVRLSCETPEGKTKHFRIGWIRFPDMPPESFRGQKYMGVHLWSATTPPDGRVIIRALRKQKIGPPRVDYPAEDLRYWNGTQWVESIHMARAYADVKQLRADVEPLKIWHIVPEEWRNDERE